MHAYMTSYKANRVACHRSVNERKEGVVNFYTESKEFIVEMSDAKQLDVTLA